ncbi:hypothetical protein ACHHYP_15391 [Achlya hypogyna]|uniref:FYVE-type domain-containing protein n=1 Tax=Achlya hypogyna TaxID=1202772 RepID=A0A1V9YB11_ACHHY|nr:hypothetical protein ACHHYP_15391 [Achlya hypogyna]
MAPGRFADVLHAYAPVVTPFIAAELLKLGHVRVYEALFDSRDMHALGTTKRVSLFEHRGNDEVAMMGCAEVTGHVLDVHRFLGNQLQNAGPVASELHALSSLFGSVFLDGYVLHTVNHPGGRGPYEQMSINWMALQAPHSSMSDRDYVFLQYADVYVRDGPDLHRITADELSLRQAHDPRLVACHVWESVELDGTSPLPQLELARARFSKWYLLCEAVAPGRVRVSIVVTQPAGNFHKAYVERLLLHLGRLESLVSRDCDSSPYCNLCLKTFSLFRRKSQCRMCKLNFCAKCILDKATCNACHEGNPMGLLRRIAATNSSDSDSVHSVATSSLALGSPRSDDTPTPSVLQRSASTPNVKGHRRSSTERTTSSTLSSSRDDASLIDDAAENQMIRVDFGKWTTD